MRSVVQTGSGRGDPCTQWSRSALLSPSEAGVTPALSRQTGSVVAFGAGLSSEIFIVLRETF